MLIFVIISQSIQSQRQINLFTGWTGVVSVSTDKRLSVQNSISGNAESSHSKSHNIDKKNPNAALLLSILPGGGQFYTHNYLKGTAFALLQGAAAGATIYFGLKRIKQKKKIILRMLIIITGRCIIIYG